VKAEAAKLPGAGISPKPCPRKCVAEKGRRTRLSDIGEGAESVRNETRQVKDSRLEGMHAALGKKCLTLEWSPGCSLKADWLHG
jgi:hypothetical protein